MGNKIILLNISYNFFYYLLDLLLVGVKKYTADLNFEKIASFASQLGSLGLRLWVSYPTLFLSESE